MDSVALFGQPPSTPEPIVAQVCRQLQADPFVSTRLSGAELDRLAAAAVRELWDYPVKTFVPVLALRSVREQLAAMGATGAEQPPPPAPAAWKSPSPRRTRDVLPVDGDVLRRDPSDHLLL